jgi:predicted AAA+ superfamily ATPase
MAAWEDLLLALNPWWRNEPTPHSLLPAMRRDAHARLLDRASAVHDRRAQLVLGRRQVGKTTLLHQVIDGLLQQGIPPLAITYYDYFDPRAFGAKLPTPFELIEASPQVTAHEVTRILVLDEIQELPGFDRWLKLLVDRADAKVIATGSSPAALRRAARESGLGRWDELVVEGLTFAEYVRLHEETDDVRRAYELAPELLERYLAIGGFPEHVHAEPGPALWARVREDLTGRGIRRERAFEDLDLYAVERLFSYCAQASGFELVVEALAEDLEVNPKTLRSYLGRLIDADLLVAVQQLVVGGKGGPPPRKTQIRAKDKVYAADHGMITAFATRRAADATRARTFEAVVYRHLRELARNRPDIGIEYFRSDDGFEVDFVVQLGRARIGVEVKSGATPGRSRQRVERAAFDLAQCDRLVHIVATPSSSRFNGHTAVLHIAEFLLNPASVLDPEDERG